MIKLKDLVNREYIEKKCFGFEYVLNNTLFKFLKEKKQENNINVWEMFIIPPDRKVSNIMFEIPKDNLPLEMICAVGLKYYQNMLCEEIQFKSELNLDIGEKIAGMFA